MELQPPSNPMITVTQPVHDQSVQNSPNGQNRRKHEQDRRGKASVFKSAHSFQITPTTLDNVLNFPMPPTHFRNHPPRTATDNDMMIPEDEEKNISIDHHGTTRMDPVEDDDDEDYEDSPNPVLLDNLSPASAAKIRNKFPNYINKSLYHVSDDENMEALVDEAVLKLLGIKKLWDDDEFVKMLYIDKEFASAVQKVYSEMAGDVNIYMKYIVHLLWCEILKWDFYLIFVVKQ